MIKFIPKLVLISIFIVPLEGYSQFSVTVTGGFALGQDKDDTYALDKVWPTSSGSGVSNQLVFLQGASGGVGSVVVSWEASSIFSLAAVYRSVSFSSSASDRHTQANSFGVQAKFNFIRNTKPIVPFIQTEYMFSNALKLSQGAVTSPTYPNQKQPAFSNYSVSTTLGIGVDLGTEIKISDPLSFIVLAGYHGIQLTNNDDKALFNSLNYGTYLKPVSFDGVFYIQITGGMKYYFGRQKKKRDF